MTHTWYKTNNWGLDITPVQVERFTEHTLIVLDLRNRESRVNKFSSTDQYWKTYEQAKDYLVKREEAKWEHAVRELSNAEHRLTRVRAL